VTWKETFKYVLEDAADRMALLKQYHLATFQRGGEDREDVEFVGALAEKRQEAMDFLAKNFKRIGWMEGDPEGTILHCLESYEGDDGGLGSCILEGRRWRAKATRLLEGDADLAEIRRFQVEMVVGTPWIYYGSQSNKDAVLDFLRERPATEPDSFAWSHCAKKYRRRPPPPRPRPIILYQAAAPRSG